MSPNYQAYAEYSCAAESIDITQGFIIRHMNLTPRYVTRSKLGLIIVIVDLTASFVFLLSHWFLAYFVRNDAERHNKLLIETCEFAVEIWNLPELN